MIKPPTQEEVKDMRDTLIVLGGKSESYYHACTPEQIEQEYKRLGGGHDDQ